MLTEMATIGENIRRWRLARGVKTQIQLADLLGVRSPQISDWERDRYKSLDTKTLKRIARALDVTLDQLIDGVSDRPIDDLPGQEIGRSELHSSADSRVNSKGTQRAKSTASTHGKLEYASSGSADRRPASPVQVAARLYDLAHDLYERADELERLADTLLSNPPGTEAPPDRHGSSAVDPDLRAHGGPPARTPPRRRRAG